MEITSNVSKGLYPFVQDSLQWIKKAASSSWFTTRRKNTSNGRERNGFQMLRRRFRQSVPPIFHFKFSRAVSVPRIVNLRDGCDRISSSITQHITGVTTLAKLVL